MRRPSLVRLVLRNDFKRDPLLDGPAPLNPPLILMAELFILLPCTIDDWLISIDWVGADDLRRKFPAFFGAFGYLNGLNDDDGCGSVWYEQHGTFGSNEVDGWSNDDRSSDGESVPLAVTVDKSSDFKFNAMAALTSLSTAKSFTSVLSTVANFLVAATFCRFIGIGGAADVDAITSHNTLPFFRPSDRLADFSFLPYDFDVLLVKWRSLFSLHTSLVSGELHAEDDFFGFVWDA